MAHVKFTEQASALLQKNWTYQKRAKFTNACLLSTPIFFCLLLLLIQNIVNILLLSSRDFFCGCQCLDCTYTDVTGVSYSGPYTKIGACPGVCNSYNDSNCALQYSSGVQAVFCGIKHPSSWPLIQQLPIPDRRYTTNRALAANFRLPTFLYTGDSAADADAVANGLFPTPVISAAPGNSALYARMFSYLGQQNNDDPTTLYGEIFTMLGLPLGSATVASNVLLLENAFYKTDYLPELLVPQATCQAAYGASYVKNKTMTMYDLIGALDPAGAAALNPALNPAAAGLKVALSAMRVSCSRIANGEAMLYQTTAKALERTLYCGYFKARCNRSAAVPNEIAGAWDFKDSSPTVFNPRLYYNDSSRTSGSQRLPPAYRRALGLLDRAATSWLKQHFPAGKAAHVLGVADMPAQPTSLKIDFSSLLGPLFFTWVVQMLFPIFLLQLTYEKERRLRMMMKMHGLGDTAYWLIMYCWYLALYVGYMILLLVVGSVIGLKIFRQNDYGVQIVFYFLYGNNMIAFAFLLSCLFISSRTAVVAGFLWVFGSGLIGDLLLRTFIQNNAWYMVLVELIPAFSLYRGLFELGEYSFLGVYRGKPGLTWKALREPGNGMPAVLIILVVEWFVFVPLAWYLEQVYASGTGIRRHPLFFLPAVQRRQKAAEEAAAAVAVVVQDELPDVAAERARVEALTAADCVESAHIVVKSLQKTYPGVDGGPPKTAVRNLTLGIEKGECFGLLGPNGAGKSTAINMMVGFHEPTSGTAVISGYDIRRDMGSIYGTMGVCPQHDLLWETLTGAEHLRFYGRLKGLRGAALESAIEASLRSVNLLSGGWGMTRQAMQYSGGMKRRLSVAVSFIGSPAVVYLDEPSTGLDPASRRNLWDVVKTNKSDRAIILTTHSMEEAEILCDRLGIFVDGRLVCIGSPRDITSRYGGYLVFSITVTTAQEAAAQEFVARLSPGARLTYALGGTLKYELPTSEVSAADVFAAMQGPARQSLGVLDWAIASATLEEVFIKFARSINAKAQELGH